MSKKHLDPLTHLFDKAADLTSPTRLSDLLALAKLLTTEECFGEAEEVLNLAYEISESGDSASHLVDCNLVMGDWNLAQEKMGPAFMKYRSACEIADSSGVYHLRLRSYLGLARFFAQNGDTSFLNAKCQQAISLAKKCGNPIDSYEFRLLLWRNENSTDKENLIHLIEMSSSLGDFEFSAQLKKQLAEQLILESHFSLAIQYLEEVHSWYVLSKNKWSARNLELSIGKFLFSSNDLAKAKYWLKKASRPTSLESYWPIEVEAEIYLRLAERETGSKRAQAALIESVAKARMLGMYQLLDEVSTLIGD